MEMGTEKLEKQLLRYLSAAMRRSFPLAINISLLP